MLSKPSRHDVARSRCAEFDGRVVCAGVLGMLSLVIVLLTERFGCAEFAGRVQCPGETGCVNFELRARLRVCCARACMCMLGMLRMAVVFMTKVNA